MAKMSKILNAAALYNNPRINNELRHHLSNLIWAGPETNRVVHRLSQHKDLFNNLKPSNKVKLLKKLGLKHEINTTNTLIKNKGSITKYKNEMPNAYILERLSPRERANYVRRETRNAIKNSEIMKNSLHRLGIGRVAKALK